MSNENTKLRCLIVDDEPIARKAIVAYAKQVEFLTVEHACGSSIEARDYLEHHEIDLIFLDINLPYLSGIDFLETLSNPPMVIFTTAYSEYALEGFRLQAVDYLLKPISFKRFFQGSVKAKELYNLKITHNSGEIRLLEENDSLVYVKQEDTYIQIDWTAICYVEAMQNYLKLYLKERTLIIHQTMIALEEILPKKHFFRIHKSYLVNIDHIESIMGGQLVILNTKLPISRLRKEALLNDVVYTKLLNKKL